MRSEREIGPSPTGRGVRVAVVDSGIYAAHPHVAGVVEGVRIRPDGGEDDEALDLIGHGTAVAAAICEKAPEVELVAVKVFDTTLSSSIQTLVRGLDWAVRRRCQLINLSLGTTRPEHEAVLATAIRGAAAAGSVVVAAGPDEGRRWLPGSLPGVLQVRADWTQSRARYGVTRAPDGVVVCHTSGYPRPIPGVPPERNLKGVSFAVANMTGFAARCVSPGERLEFDLLVSRLCARAAAWIPPAPVATLHGLSPLA